VKNSTTHAFPEREREREGEWENERDRERQILSIVTYSTGVFDPSHTHIKWTKYVHYI
jgi:two-component sensor histidine kinase